MRTERVSIVSLDEPISINEARMHLRSPEITTNDSEILRFVQTAKRMAEHRLDLKLIAETWDGFLDAFPLSEIEIPLAPLSSVLSIKYYDSDNILRTVPTTDYTVDTSGDLGRILLGFQKSWPGSVALIENAVIIRFVIGYANADAIPANIKSYIKLALGSLNNDRELTTEREEFLTKWADRLLDPDRVVGV